MIHPDSRTLHWIQEVAERYKFKEVQLIEKSIRAFSLLEALVQWVPLRFQRRHVTYAPLEQFKEIVNRY